MALKGLPITFAKTFSLPRWGMPILISFAPKFPPLFIICSKAGISDSPPSKPNLLVPTNLTCKYFSKHHYEPSLPHQKELLDMAFS